MEIKPITLRYLFNVNSYLVKTESDYFLIDTGIANKRGELEKKLVDAGCMPGDLKLVIITHGHLDHVGNAAYLRDGYGAKIAMHRGDSEMAESGDMFAGVRGRIIVGFLGIVIKLLGLSDYDGFTPDIYLEDGKNLKEHSFDAKVIYTPGHSPGSVSILTAEGDLFCGDVLDNTKKPAKNTLVQDAVELDTSVEKIKTLATGTVYPGHGKPFQITQLA